MDAINEFFSDYWIYLTVAGFLLLFTVPWIFVWRARRNRNWLVANGRSAQAKILKITASGLTVGTSSSSNNGGGSMRGVNLLLEVYPENGQPYQVKTREQLHLLDLSRITPGMMVELRIHPTKSNKVVVSQWSK
ncbi:MAG: hypothetical protein DHS20C20_17490 [Ardenticatenaceae bacterium]|nr:MAG: hypothetical protein DHS20C20_17490 [Ardenticatenaceae bacterium]